MVYSRKVAIKDGATEISMIEMVRLLKKKEEYEYIDNLPGM